MACSPRPGCVRRAGRAALALLALVSAPARAQTTTLKLEDVNVRNSLDFAPKHVHEKVTVTGIVNAPPFHFPAYSLLTMEAQGFGAVLRVTDRDTRLDAFRPGDEIQADGTIEAFAGMAVIRWEER